MLTVLPRPQRFHFRTRRQELNSVEGGKQLRLEHQTSLRRQGHI